MIYTTQETLFISQEINEEVQDLSIDITVNWLEDNSYGSDIDGFRGTSRTTVESFEIESITDNYTLETIELTQDIKELILERLGETLWKNKREVRIRRRD